MRMDMETEKKRLKVYCETSFWSWLVSRPSTDPDHAVKQAWTRKWWEEVAPKCEIFVSQHVRIEAAKGNERMAELRMNSMSASQPLDGMIESVENLARLLQSGHAIPEKEAADAAHIATAAVYGMDVLLTWNCKHMANLVTMPKTAAIIAKAGYECPVIITPDEFLLKKEVFAQ